ncbi:MAG: type II toxin-antitoxin system HigB family toxin [Bryobacteraceae bacterium]
MINRQALRQMMKAHSDAEAALDAWWRATKAARWDRIGECRQSFAGADQVGRCLIFDILGNKYRLITVVSWRNQRIYVKAFLTHREYERNTWHKWAF